MPSALKGSKVLSSVSGTEPPLMAADRIRGEAYAPRLEGNATNLSSNWQECRTTKKALRL